MNRTQAWMIVLILGAAVLPAKAEILLQDDFEGPDGQCQATWDYSETSGISFTDARSHGGNCSAAAVYTHDEDASHLWAHGPDSPSRVIHGIYWEYLETDGNWPRHLKRNRFFTVGDVHLGIVHPQFNGEVLQTYYNRDSAGLYCTFDWSGDPTEHAGTWRKIEFYAEMTDAGVAATCPGNDILRVWIDDEIVVDSTEWVMQSSNADGFKSFWLFGNASDGEYPLTVYMDDICIDTNCECGGLACGGTPIDDDDASDGPPPPPENVYRTDQSG